MTVLNVLASLTLAASVSNYKSWCIGNCDKDVSTVTTPGAVLMGGGVRNIMMNMNNT
jgi:hypothetical protein